MVWNTVFFSKRHFQLVMEMVLFRQFLGISFWSFFVRSFSNLCHLNYILHYFLCWGTCKIGCNYPVQWCFQHPVLQLSQSSYSLIPQSHQTRSDQIHSPRITMRVQHYPTYIFYYRSLMIMHRSSKNAVAVIQILVIIITLKQLLMTFQVHYDNQQYFHWNGPPYQKPDEVSYDKSHFNTSQI